MKNFIITIRHASGNFKLNVASEKLEEIKEHIMFCISGKQDAFTNKDLKGNEQIYPAEVLKNSIISIEIDNEDDDVK
ncbi:hypothetical protein [Chryseobacterium lathyri]|uniref:hypothetical protein n=1 Tax=Chryseobacterium lathyri TaxID=395933 RepID=UPI001CC1B251|nr:hypothetical protein [Chryseobacterium lathyri]